MKAKIARSTSIPPNDNGVALLFVTSGSSSLRPSTGERATLREVSPPPCIVSTVGNFFEIELDFLLQSSEM